MEPLGLYHESDDGHLILLGRWPGRCNYGRLFGFYRDALFSDLSLSRFAFHYEGMHLRRWLHRRTSAVTMNYIRQGLVRAMYCIDLQRQRASTWFPVAEFGTPGRRALALAQRMVRCELRGAIR